MTIAEWSLVAGVATSLALALGPWMFKVHAKLAVIAAKLADLCERLEETHVEHRQLRKMCGRHQSRLDTHDVQLAHLAERLPAGIAKRQGS
jgi:hypothetical protein